MTSKIFLTKNKCKYEAIGMKKKWKNYIQKIKKKKGSEFLEGLNNVKNGNLDNQACTRNACLD